MNFLYPTNSAANLDPKLPNLLAVYTLATRAKAACELHNFLPMQMQMITANCKVGLHICSTTDQLGSGWMAVEQSSIAGPKQDLANDFTLPRAFNPTLA